MRVFIPITIINNAGTVNKPNCYTANGTSSLCGLIPLMAKNVNNP
jgi:hypothetical protein